MLAKSEIALLTVTVFGTLTAWLAGPHPSLVTPIYDEPSIACIAPATAFLGVRPFFGEEKASFEQVPRISSPFPQHPRCPNIHHHHRVSYAMLRILHCQIKYVGEDHPADGPVRMAAFRECGDDQERTRANGCWSLKIGRRVCLVLSHREPPPSR